MSFSKRTLILLSIFLIGLAPCLMAQKGASRLEGTVKDSTGGVVPGASVIATNVDTGVAREVFSSESGNYIFPTLPPGTYNVAVELTGFKRAVAENVKLDVAATVVQNLVLEVGELSETVTVTAAGAAPIQTTTSDIADTVQGQTIISLPLNGRNPLELVQLNAGIPGNRGMSERSSGADPAGNDDNQAGLGANGARAVNNAVYLDGVDITNSEDGTRDGYASAADLTQSVDAIGEFRVISANPTAEFGKNSGMQIEIVTRSGTNELHGSLYQFHRNTILNANDFFNNHTGVDRPKLIRNQFGGTVGGPVILPWLYNGRNKTFFFFNYEGFRERRGAITDNVVMTETARNGIFRYYTGGPNATSLVDPASGAVKSQYAGSVTALDVPQLDVTRWDGIGKDKSGIVDRYISLTPKPNYFGNPEAPRDGLNFASYRFNAPDPDNRNNWVVKFDHVIGARHTASVRYNQGKLTTLADREPFPGLPTRTRDEYQRGVSINVISNLTPTVTNEFRFGFTRNRREFTSLLNAGDIVADCDTAFECTGTTNPDLTGEPSITARMTYQVTNNISWAKKNHLFKGGVTVRTFPLNRLEFANQLNIDFNSEPRNQQNATVNLAQLLGTTNIPVNANDRIPLANFFNFYLGRVGGTFADFNATDIDTWGTFGSGRVRGFRSSEWGFFFQDDWRVNDRLTLNLGVRYELFGVPYEVNSFFTTTINRKLLDPQIDVLYVAPPVEFGVIGPKTGQKIYPMDYNNFAPTVGFSYDPFGKGKTAIRAAYRVSYDRLFSSTVDTIDANAPGLLYTSVINGDTLRDTGTFVKLAPGGLNAGLAMTPRLADLKGTSVGGIALNGTFDLNQFIGSTRSQGGPMPDKPLGTLTNTRNSAGPYEFAADLRTAYGQSWSLSIQHELMRGTVIEARYVGRKGTKEYIGLPAN
ncbi:MAG: TonB-dependent receptor, partial [Acidobacteriota bacterium]